MLSRHGNRCSSNVCFGVCFCLRSLGVEVFGGVGDGEWRGELGRGETENGWWRTWEDRGCISIA